LKILKFRESFEICGLKTRANNADEMSGRGVIANLWGEFLKFNASRSSAEKNEIYAAYYDYENGAQGEYSVLNRHLLEGTAPQRKPRRSLQIREAVLQK